MQRIYVHNGPINAHLWNPVTMASPQKMPPGVREQIQKRYIILNENIGKGGYGTLAFAIRREALSKFASLPNQPIDARDIDRIRDEASVLIKYVGDDQTPQSLMKEEVELLRLLREYDISNVAQLIEVDGSYTMSGSNFPFMFDCYFEDPSPCRYFITKAITSGLTLDTLLSDKDVFPNGHQLPFICHLFLNLGRTLSTIHGLIDQMTLTFEGLNNDNILIEASNRGQYPDFIIVNFGTTINREHGETSCTVNQFRFSELVGALLTEHRPPKKDFKWLLEKINGIYKSAGKSKPCEKWSAQWESFVDAVKGFGLSDEPSPHRLIEKYDPMMRACIEEADSSEKERITDSIARAIAKRQEELKIDNEAIQQAIFKDFETSLSHSSGTSP